VLSENYLNYRPIAIEELIGKKGKKQGSMRDVDVARVKEYAAEDADITLQLKNCFEPMLKEAQLEKLFSEVEMPLIPVLADMESEGVALDTAFLHEYSKQLTAEIIAAREQVFTKAKTEFNLDSPRQLADVLFVKLGIPYPGAKTKTGQYSTGDDILSELEPQHEICRDLRNYRELTKLKSTYVDALPEMINSATGRIHTTFHQTIAATGRLSSQYPNLQNIPIKTERGREIRKAFIPRNENFRILSADYSQIELRIIAALSSDEAMIEAFRQGMDIHLATAAKVFGVEPSQVTREMRGRAKAVNFGISYGQTAFGLSKQLGISRSEAQQIITTYKMQFPGVSRLMEENIRFAREHGYTQTILGRKRELPDIFSKNFTVRGFAERNAINAPIQGSAADLIKVAMINIHRAMNEMKLKSRMTLQVHDELVFDAALDELDVLKPLVIEKMKTALAFNVPIEVDAGVGMNWLEAHE
jgi:DNA polymerase-1